MGMPLETWRKCRVSGSTSDLLNQNLYSNNTPNVTHWSSTFLFIWHWDVLSGYFLGATCSSHSEGAGGPDCRCSLTAHVHVPPTSLLNHSDSCVLQKTASSICTALGLKRKVGSPDPWQISIILVRKISVSHCICDAVVLLACLCTAWLPSEHASSIWDSVRWRNVCFFPTTCASSRQGGAESAFGSYWAHVPSHLVEPQHCWEELLQGTFHHHSTETTNHKPSFASCVV